MTTAASSASVINNALEQVALGNGELYRGDDHWIQITLKHLASIAHDFRSSNRECELTELEKQMKVMAAHYRNLVSNAPSTQ